ncbi:hypothetical protein STEG23_024261 [Scotinomys teguina]
MLNLHYRPIHQEEQSANLCLDASILQASSLDIFSCMTAIHEFESDQLTECPVIIEPSSNERYRKLIRLKVLSHYVTLQSNSNSGLIWSAVVHNDIISNGVLPSSSREQPRAMAIDYKVFRAYRTPLTLKGVDGNQSRFNFLTVVNRAAVNMDRKSLLLGYGSLVPIYQEQIYKTLPRITKMPQRNMTAPAAEMDPDYAKPIILVPSPLSETGLG